MATATADSDERRDGHDQRIEVVLLAPGETTVADLPASARDATAALISEGLVLREVVVDGHVVADLLGPGELLALQEPDDELVAMPQRWLVVRPTRLTVLDELLRRRPEISSRLLERSVEQLHRQARLRALSHYPRIEQRVLALLWLLAERWGRVASEGLLLPLVLTHEVLGRMVGARRPTISLALKALAEDGCARRRDDGVWVLDRAGAEKLLAAGPHRPARLRDVAVAVLEDEPVALSREPRPRVDSTPVSTEVELLSRRVAELESGFETRREQVTQLLGRSAAAREAVARRRRQDDGRKG